MGRRQLDGSSQETLRIRKMKEGVTERQKAKEKGAKTMGRSFLRSSWDNILPNFRNHTFI
jgi:hypothetical protein